MREAAVGIGSSPLHDPKLDKWVGGSGVRFFFRHSVLTLTLCREDRFISPLRSHQTTSISPKISLQDFFVLVFVFIFY